MNNVLEAQQDQQETPATAGFRLGIYAGSLAPAVLDRVTQLVNEAWMLGAEVVAIATERDGESARRLADLHHVRCDYAGIGDLAGHRGLDGVVLVLDEGGDMAPLEDALDRGLNAFVPTESPRHRRAVLAREHIAKKRGAVLGLYNGHSAAVAESSRWILGGGGIGEVLRVDGSWFGTDLEAGIDSLLSAALPFLPVEKVWTRRRGDSIRVELFGGGKHLGALEAIFDKKGTDDGVLSVEGSEGLADLPLQDDPRCIYSQVVVERRVRSIAGASAAPRSAQSRSLGLADWFEASAARRGGRVHELSYASPAAAERVSKAFRAFRRSLEEGGERVSAARL